MKTGKGEVPGLCLFLPCSGFLLAGLGQRAHEGRHTATPGDRPGAGALYARYTFSCVLPMQQGLFRAEQEWTTGSRGSVRGMDGVFLCLLILHACSGAIPIGVHAGAAARAAKCTPPAPRMQVSLLKGQQLKHENHRTWCLPSVFCIPWEVTENRLPAPHTSDVWSGLKYQFVTINLSLKSDSVKMTL